MRTPPRLIRVLSQGLPVLVITLDEHGFGRWGEEMAGVVQEHGEALIRKRVKLNGRIRNE
ncbi:MAG: hypothetical protein ACLQNE_39650 [Thermoguttaceae bacterium]